MFTPDAKGYIMWLANCSNNNISLHITVKHFPQHSGWYGKPVGFSSFQIFHTDDMAIHILDIRLITGHTMQLAVIQFVHVQCSMPYKVVNA